MLNFNNIKEDVGSIRIVYVVENIFTKRDYERFYINELIENGFEVLIVDVTELIYGKLGNSLNIKSIDANYTRCKSIKQFYEIVNEFKPNFSINLVHHAKNKYLHRFIIQLILKKKSKLIEYYCENLPLNLSFLSIKFFLNGIFFIPWFFLRPSYNIVTNQNSIKFARGKLIKLHENDYDLYLKSSRKTKENSISPYLLFLDEGGPFHQDFIFQKIKCPLTPEIYYPEINKSLFNLADNLKLQPLVQLHPRVNGDDIKKYFQIGISNASTVDAIRDASLIVAHSSTAIQIAVLFQKPIILLKTTQLLEFKTSKLLINNFAKILKCPCIWPEEASQIHSIPSVNINSYLEYQNQYTKIPNTLNEFNSKILIEFLVKEHNLNP
jgi:hypothetical protein